MNAGTSVSGVTAAYWRPCGTTDTEAPGAAVPLRQCDIVVRCTTMSYAGAQAEYRASGVIYVTLILRKICVRPAIYGTMTL